MSGLVTFGSTAITLELNGFQPIPITPPNPHDPQAGKRPAVENWQNFRPVAERLPRYARCGTGLLTATTPAVDIDVRHPEVAQAIDRMVVDLLGDAPSRIGAVPKCLRQSRTNKPFLKISTQEYVLPGDQPGDKGHKVEVLGDGQQFVAFGIHPGTGRPYHWPDFSPLDLEWHDLPELTAETAAAVVAKAEELLRRAGGRVRAKGSKPSKPLSERQPGPRPRPVRSLAELIQVKEALRKIDPNRLDYDGWIKVGFALKAAMADRGHDVWLAWSKKSERDQPDYTVKAWKWIKPSRCGWRYILKLAEETR